MGVPLTKDFVAAVRHAGDIVRLVSDYVVLRPAGTRLKGLCPFHQEKSPSFSVDPAQQLFYCFGCQTGGDLFKFVMLYEKTDFAGAVETLARRFGVPVPASDSAEDRVRRRLLEMNDAAAAFFAASLSDAEAGHVARAYLERRGLVRDTVARLRIGFAPDSWDALSSHLMRHRFVPREILSGGLAVQRKTGDGQYDRFRNRIMFPIRDAGGRTVAFGGRALADGEPKYLNSPETAAYVKGDHLYGLDLARDAIRREGFAIVVEGYLDLAAVVQAGFANVVASLGTAFTPAHARLLSRYATRIVVSYDGDAAGSAAAARSLDVLLDRGLEVRVAELPAGLDPDDLIRRDGAEAYASRIRRAPGYFDFLLGREAASRDLGRIEEKVAAINALLPRLARLTSAVERASWAARIADALAVEDDLVLQELKAALRQAKGSIRQRVESAAAATVVPSVDARLVAVLLADPEARSAAAESLDAAALDGSPAAPIVAAILRLEAAHDEVSGASVSESLESDDDRRLLAEIVNRDEPPPAAGELEFFVGVLRRRRLRRAGRAVQKRIEGEPDGAVDDLLAERMRLAREMDALSRGPIDRAQRTSEER